MTSVAVVVPTLNEAQYIDGCLERLLAQLPQDGRLYVADGGSSDGTVERVEAISQREPRVALVRNVERSQAAGVNLVARLVKGETGVLIRADAHSGYPADFIAKLLADFAAFSPASVVVPMRTVGTACFQRAVAAAQNSRLGNGGSAHRGGNGASRYVEHGHHALFDLSYFEKVGGYDTAFWTNEDAELDVRIRKAGGKIWMCGGASIDYYPRRDPVSLARQYFRHGLGRGQSIAKHNLRPNVRQQLPIVVLGVSAAALLLAPVWPVGLIVPAGYALACLGWGAALALRARDPCILGSGAAAMIMHMSWAAGAVTAWVRSRMKPDGGSEQSIASDVTT